jgi:hypothetical protein
MVMLEMVRSHLFRGVDCSREDKATDLILDIDVFESPPALLGTGPGRAGVPERPPHRLLRDYKAHDLHYDL